MRNFNIVTPVLNIEGEQCGACSILIKFDDGVYICSCSFRYERYLCKKKYAFVYNSNLKPLHQPKCCGCVLDNREDAPICVVDENE